MERAPAPKSLHDVRVAALDARAVDALVEGVARALAREERADRIARRALRALALDGDVARRTFARTLIGTVGLALRLAYLVGRVAPLPADARLLAAAWLVDEGKEDPGLVAARLALDDDTRSLVEAVRTRAWPSDRRARLVVERAIPAPLLARLARTLDDDTIDTLFAVLNKPGPMCARVDLRKITREALLDDLARAGVAVRAGALADTAIVFEGRYDVDNCPSARAGLYTVQDEGSQLIAHAARPREGERVLDLCAGRGGKTLALAELAAPGAHIVASDVDGAALAAARGRLARAGASVPVVDLSGLSADARVQALAVHGPYDVVLVDAPCTQVGALRRGPDARAHVTDALVDALTATQAALLDEARALVRPGGRVVYATCSLLADENERVVDDAIARGGLVASPLALPRALCGDDATRLTLWPHVHGCDGFFIAGLTRVA